MKIHTVFIDMYGVILKESKGNFLPYTYSRFEQSRHAVLTRLIREEKLFTKASNGEITSDEFLLALGYDRPEFFMRDYIENHLTLDEGFIPFAEKYKDKYNFILLSNDISEWSDYITEYHGLNKYFKAKIISGREKCRKPERQMFLSALKACGAPPAHCIFVDNSVANLDAAMEVGITPVLFNRDGVKYGGMTAADFSELDKLLENEERL